MQFTTSDDRPILLYILHVEFEDRSHIQEDIYEDIDTACDEADRLNGEYFSIPYSDKKIKPDAVTVIELDLKYMATDIIYTTRE